MEFEEFQQQVMEKIEMIKNRFSSMKQKFEACEEFHQNIVAPAHGMIDDAQKQTEQNLLNAYKKSMQDFLAANHDLEDLYQQSPY